MLSCLATNTPLSIFAQNNGVISLTRCANRSAGYYCCGFIVTYGILAKISGAFLSIPAPVLGGVTTFCRLLDLTSLYLAADLALFTLLQCSQQSSRPV